MSLRVSVITVNFNHKYFPKVQVEALEKSSEYNKKSAHGGGRGSDGGAIDGSGGGAIDGSGGGAIEIEIVYVDNASSDPISIGFLEHASADGRLKLVRSAKNLGFAGGNNLGVKNASRDSDYIFILNPDTSVHEDAIEKMVRYLEANRDVGLLGPKLMYPDGTVQESCRRDMGFLDLMIKRTWLRYVPGFSRRVDRYLMHDFDHGKTQEVELITGAAMILPRRVFDEVGGFDDRYFLFMEDFDLCKKVRAAGYKIVYFPEAIVDHYHKRLSEGNVFGLLFKKVFRIHVMSAVKYFWKWRGSRTTGERVGGRSRL